MKLGGLMFRGYEILNEEYCTRRSCKNLKCKRNQKNVKSSQSGIEYTVKSFANTSECLGYVK